MRTKIFSFIKPTENSVVASSRIAKFVSETLNIPIVWDETIGDQELDILLIVNGSYAFTGNTVLAGLAKAIETANRICWVQNDYTIIPPKDESGAESPFRKAFRNRFAAGKSAVDYWTIVEPMSHPDRVVPPGLRTGSLSTYINWNVLTMTDTSKLDDKVRCFPTALVYYGSYRKNREKYFDRYFWSPKVMTHISSPSKKFEERYEDDHLIFWKKWDDVVDNLRDYGLGLYIKDNKPHLEFPANRLYEMMSANLPIVFQPESQRMMEKAGYDVTDFIAWNADEIPKFMEKQDEIREAQRPWAIRALAERAELDAKVKEHWSKYL